MSDPSPSSSHRESTSDASSLAHTLNQTAQVKDKVAVVGDELLVINAVLKQELPQAVKIGEVAQALDKSDELEIKVQECVDDLEQVNQALEDEVTKRHRLEQQLARSQAELAKQRSVS